MSSGTLVFLEMMLVLGLVLGLAFMELRSLRKDKGRGGKEPKD
jgi:hypothetical protein